MHHFEDKEAILAFALEQVVHTFSGEVKKFLDGDATLDGLRELLNALLPKSTGLTFWKSWLSFTVSAFSKPELAKEHSVRNEELRDFFASVLSMLKNQGGISTDVDPEVEADTLLCLLDGISIHAVIANRRMNSDHQEKILRAYFRRLAAA